MEATADPILEEMVQRIVRRFDPEKIVLFGSRARGDFRPDSDYDLLVVLKSSANRRATAIAIRGALAHMHASKDVIVVSKAEVEEPQRWSLIVREALREGHPVYERA